MSLNKKNRSPNGFAALAILVAFAILLLLYFLDITAIFKPVSRAVKSASPVNRPWLEESRILGPDKLIKLPKPPKPQLDEPIVLTATVTRDGQDRGEVTIEFNTAGEVSGSWGCEYTHEERHCRIDADFAGNIDISKTFTNKKTTDNFP